MLKKLLKVFLNTTKERFNKWALLNRVCSCSGQFSEGSWSIKLLHCSLLFLKKCCLMSGLNLLWHSFESFPRALLLDTRERSLAPPSLLHLLWKLYRAMWSLFSLLSSKLDKPKILSHSFWDLPSIPATNFVALLWTHPRTFTSFLNWSPEQHSVLKVTLHQCWVQQDGHLSWLAAVAVFDAPQDGFALLPAQAHTADWYWACCWPEPTGLLLQSFSPAAPLPGFTCDQSYFIPSAESCILTC